MPSAAANLIARRMPPDMADAVRAVARASERIGARPHLVGGSVRDLLATERGASPSPDIDIALESADAAAFNRIAAQIGGRVSKRSQFGTAKLDLDGLSIDLALTRAERYPAPGALPQVRPASLAEDLARRDFTVNAMAISLSSATFGELADPCGGLTDLRQSKLRALHARSFQDDATRIIRAARYCARLSLDPTDETRRWIADSAPFIKTISPARIRAELERLFLEGEAAARAMSLLDEWDTLSAIHPALSPPARAAWTRFSERAGETPQDDIIPTAYAIIGAPLTDAQIGGITERLRPASRSARALTDAAELTRALSNEPAAANLATSRLIAILDRFDDRAAVGVSLAAPAAAIRARLTACVQARAADRPHLSGDDLIALGIPPGPAIGEILTRLRAARLDRETAAPEDERRLAQKLIADIANRTPPALDAQHSGRQNSN